jgi:hypothetical protein
MEKFPTSVEEGVGGGTDSELKFSVSGDNHPVRQLTDTPPESGGEDFPRMPHSTYPMRVYP